MHKNFVPPTAPHAIAVLGVQLDAAAFRTVRQQLHAAFPALAQLAASRQCQMVNGGDMLRILPVNGGVIPADITADAVSDVIRTTLEAQPAHSVLWAEAQTIRYARRGR